MSSAKMFGKYRGTVVNSADPELRCRIQAMVPDVAGYAISSWALPALPIGGLAMGMYSPPVPGSGVWIEFEQGDIDYPIWTGIYWGSAAEVPALSHLIPPGVPGIVMQTVLQNGLVISDVPGPTGGIMLTTTAGAMILINDVGITLSNGQGAMIQMTGPTVVINGGALTVV
jgi:Type VI secretion system/phage-baseplate injector OB domain